MSATELPAAAQLTCERAKRAYLLDCTLRNLNRESRSETSKFSA